MSNEQPLNLSVGDRTEIKKAQILTRFRANGGTDEEFGKVWTYLEPEIRSQEARAVEAEAVHSARPKRSKMTMRQRVDFIGEHGSHSYLALDWD